MIKAERVKGRGSLPFLSPRNRIYKGSCMRSATLTKKCLFVFYLFVLVVCILYYFYLAYLANLEEQEARELSKYTALANKGDMRGAYFMYQHYGLKAFYEHNSEEQKHAELQAQYWHRKIADLGDAAFQFGVGTDLVKKNQIKSGCEYIQKSAAQGYSDAREFLKRSQDCK